MNNYISVDGVEIYKSGKKDSERKTALLCFSNVLKDFSVNNMKRAGLSINFYDLPVDCDTISDDDT